MCQYSFLSQSVDQTVCMQRLICAVIVCIGYRRFSHDAAINTKDSETNKSSDQTACMKILICAFVVIYADSRFHMTWLVLGKVLIRLPV